MEEKVKKLCGYIFAALVVVGLVLVIVGMCIDIITITASVLGVTVSESYGLFHDMWSAPGAPSTTFLLIAFIVAIAGAAVLLVDAILRVFLGKDIKIVRMLGAAVAFVGAVLILVAGLMLVSECNDIGKGFSAGAGVWLGFIGGLVAAVGGGLPLLKAFN